MKKTYESMSLKEVLAAGKAAGVTVPLHLRGADAVHDPRILEEARQYLVAQLNALYMKEMVRRIYIAVTAILAAVMALLIIYGKQYYDAHKPAPLAYYHAVTRSTG